MVYTVLAVVSAAGLLASAGCHVAGLSASPRRGARRRSRSTSASSPCGYRWSSAPTGRCRRGRAGTSTTCSPNCRPGARAASALFVYAIVNFVVFLWMAGQYPKGQAPLPLVLRGFSGHWMLFYGVATAGFVGLARLRQEARSGPGA